MLFAAQMRGLPSAHAAVPGAGQPAQQGKESKLFAPSRGAIRQNRGEIEDTFYAALDIEIVVEIRLGQVELRSAGKHRPKRSRVSENECHGPDSLVRPKASIPETYRQSVRNVAAEELFKDLKGQPNRLAAFFRMRTHTMSPPRGMMHLAPTARSVAFHPRDA